jgi:hypothetical protein
MTIMLDEDSVGIDVEDERALWRADIAERHLGLDPLRAAMVAANPLVDVCTARELVARGCPAAIAIELATRE